MKVFEHPNYDGGFECPICHKSDDKPVVLIGIWGTEEGYNMRANQYHLDCIELFERSYADKKLIYQIF